MHDRRMTLDTAMAETMSAQPSPAAQGPLAAINSADDLAFLALAGPYVENAPWLVARVGAHRPFSTPADFHGAICREIRACSRDDQFRLLNAHPELAGQEAQAGGMTRASTSEQNRLGLDRLESATARLLVEGNSQYRLRFGFPFIVALHRQPDLAAVMRFLKQRFQADHDAELLTALDEVSAVVAGRVARTFGPFTTHSQISNGD